MDEKLSQALERSNYMTTLATQRRMLAEKFQTDLIYYKDGHEIEITETLIAFCKSLLDLNRSSVVLIDSNKLPLAVDDIPSFLSDIIEQYAHASNQYHAEYQKLKKQRSVEGLIDL